jgi:hypothetical protein
LLRKLVTFLSGNDAEGEKTLINELSQNNNYSACKIINRIKKTNHNSTEFYNLASLLHVPHRLGLEEFNQLLESGMEEGEHKCGKYAFAIIKKLGQSDGSEVAESRSIVGGRPPSKLNEEIARAWENKTHPVARWCNETESNFRCGYRFNESIAAEIAAEVSTSISSVKKYKPANVLRLPNPTDLCIFCEALRSKRSLACGLSDDATQFESRAAAAEFPAETWDDAYWIFKWHEDLAREIDDELKTSISTANQLTLVVDYASNIQLEPHRGDAVGFFEKPDLPVLGMKWYIL